MKHCLVPIAGHIATLLILLFVAEVARGQQIQFRPAQPLQASGQTLSVGAYAIPCVGDWNGDGHKDLLVGYQTAGKIAVFLNTGSDSSPAFAGSYNLQAGGIEICLPSSGCGAPAPFVCDYNGDGKRDLLVGSGADGYVYFYCNTNTDAHPILDAGTRLMVGANPLSVTYRATPCLHDWDGDGLPDLLCGNGDGYVFWFRNTESAQAPAYAAGARLQAGGVDLNLGIRAIIRMYDLDGDGLIDLVGSSNNGVYWCRNVGSRTAPVLLAPVALRCPVTGSGLQPIYTGVRMRLDLVDWNSDGVMDLMLGNANGTVNYYEGYRFAITSVSAQSPGPCTLQWNSAGSLSYHVLAGPAPDAMTNFLVKNLASGGNTTSWTNPSPAAGQQFYRVQLAP